MDSNATKNQAHFRRSTPIGAVIVIALFLSIVGWIAYRDSVRTKEIAGQLAGLRAAGEPTTWNDLSRTHPDPSPADDATPLYGPAFGIATNQPAPFFTPLVMGNPLAPTQSIDPDILRRLTEYCRSTAGIADALPKSLALQARFPMRWGDTNGPPLKFSNARNLIQMLAAHVIEAAETQDAERATQLIEGAFRFTGCINYYGVYVDHMIRHACQGLVCAVTERALNRTTFTDEQLQRIARSIRIEEKEDLRDCVRAEHVLAIWIFQEMRAGRPITDITGAVKKEPLWKRWWERIRTRRPDYDDQDFIRYLGIMSAEVEATVLPTREGTNNAHMIATNFNANVVSRAGQGLSVGHLAKILRSHREAEMHDHILLTVLALERYRLANTNKIPTSLDVLVPDYLEKLPFDVTGGKPLKLTPLPAGYMVYSLGPDGEDNGGTPKATGNVVGGYDIPITITK